MNNCELENQDGAYLCGRRRNNVVRFINLHLWATAIGPNQLIPNDWEHRPIYVLGVKDFWPKLKQSVGLTISLSPTALRKRETL